MIYLFLGPDTFSKKQFIDELKAKGKLELIRFYDDATEDNLLKAALNSSLFDTKKIIISEEFITKNSPEASFFDKLGGSENIVIFLENALDKRKTENKKIIANRKIVTKDFAIPTGDAFKKWTEGRAKYYDLKLNNQALQEFLFRLGINQGEFGKELYTLWQVDSELHKLKLYVGGKEASKEDVQDIVSENIDEDIFKITNAIGDKNKTQAVKYLTNYLDRIPGTDEKTKIISISALLADQFRNIMIIQGMSGSGVPEEEIMRETGFSSGRLFVYKKIARNFQREKLLETLRKMEMLDEELKTSSGPASLQFFMIMESVLR
jgi:DNA polymerase-3 subunit delta